MTSFDSILTALRGISESSRLRILSVLLHGELTVSEITEVLGQSQPRVSRHLKILSDAGVIERHQEGSWVFYRLSDHPLIESIRQCISRNDPQFQRDQSRLESIRTAQRDYAANYFRENAARWDQIRTRYLSESQVEDRLLEILNGKVCKCHVDLGTGTGRMLQLFSNFSHSATGIDNSREMLSVARANLASENYLHCQARYGDIRHPDLEDASADLVTLHHVLHYMNSPVAVIQQAARLLSPGGLLIIVDFAPHHNEQLRTEFAHRRLGFEASEISTLLEHSGLICKQVISVGESQGEAGSGEEALDVLIWVGTQADNKPYTLAS